MSGLRTIYQRGRGAACIAAASAVVLVAAPQYRGDLTTAQLREERNSVLGQRDLSPLSLVHREYFGDRKRLTVGSGERADVRLPDANLASIAATLDIESAKSVPLSRLGRFVLNFRPGGLAQGAAVDVYDTAAMTKKQFRALDVFPIDPAYRVQATMQPLAAPQKITLTDSQGFDRPYWIYGHLTFRIHGQALRLEVYAPALDRAEIARDGFMLIFGDVTNGKETYKAGRYLYIEGKLSGAVEVDFNRTQTPPCNFSAAFTCPFPRKENRMNIAIRAGERTYTGPTPQLLKSR